MNDYFELGEHLDWSDRGELYPATAALVKACQEHPDIDFREVRFELQGGNRTEFVVITAGDGSVAEGNPGGIRRRERLAISVNPTHRVPIVVLTLRKDFPSLSHQHARAPGKPRTLCLYEMVWSAVETSWTAERFLSRMFWWLRESAQLRLHRKDQPLEQLFYMSPYQLILPANHAEYAKPAFGKLSIQRVDEGQTVTLKAVPADEACGSKSVRMIAIGVPAVDTNAVATFPETLGALHEQLVSWGSNLSTQLFESVFDAIPEGIAPSKGQGEGLLILVWVPRIRNGEVERPDVMGYMVNASLFELASAMDMLGPKNANGVHFRVQLLDGRFGAVWESFPVFPVEIRPSLDANAARDLSAIDPQEASFQGVLAGVGALGGTLADIWVRECWGHWTFIDPDQVLPHNLSRHIAVDSYVGYRKALVVQDIAKAIYPHESPLGAIVKSIVGEGEDISKALSAAQLVVDVTTTFEAPRGLALRDNVPRTVSLFMTPSGLSSEIGRASCRERVL